MKPIRVLIAESHGQPRTGLAAHIAAFPDIIVVAEARDVPEVIKKARDLKPEAILIDFTNVTNGLEILSQIKANLPTCATVALSDSEKENDVLRALSYGAQGCLLKRSPTAEIVQALKKVTAGEVVLPQSITTILTNRLQEKAREPKLSQRESEVLRLLGEGLRNREIAHRLVVSESTVRTYIYRLQEKLGIKSRVDLSIHARRNLLPIELTKEELKLLQPEPELVSKGILTGGPAGQVILTSPSREQARHSIENASASSHPILPERKLATALSVQLNWSEYAKKPTDADTIEQTVNECRDLVAEEIKRYGGTTAWFTSRGLVSLFGVPTSLEHAPQKALHAALAIVEHIKGLSEQHGGGEIRMNVRIGINTGMVLVECDTDGLPTIFKPTGNAIELAIKARDAAKPDAIAVTQSTFNLARHDFVFKSLGKIRSGENEESVNIHRLIEMRALTRKQAKGGLRRRIKFVGRDKEIDLLKTAWFRAKSGAGQVVGIVGEAGVGKSRLLLEFIRELRSEEYMYLEGSCRHYGESIAYLPLLQILRAYFEITGEERESTIKKRITKRIGQLDRSMLRLVQPLQDLLGLGADDEEYQALEAVRKREMIFDAIRELILRQSQNKPVVIAIEDCQWIDKTSEEFLNDLINSLPSGRMMVVLLYRPEYHHNWTAKSNYQHIVLNQLSSQASTELVNFILQGEVAPDLRELIVSKAGGNPLFIEELTRSLLENGSIEKRDHKYVLARGSSEIAVPATIQGIIAARLDCLGGELKWTLQTASVIGRTFSFGLLQTIAGMPQQLRFYLQDLLGLEFIYRNWVDPKSEYVFKHACIQDVVYHSLPLMTKRKIHERIGDTIEQLYPDRLEEFYEVLAHHYRNSQNWDKAYHYLRVSGDKAARSCANREALKLYRDAIDVLNRISLSRDRQARELEIRLAMDGVLRGLDYPEGSLANLQEAEKLAEELGNAVSKAIALGKMGWYHVYRDNATLGMKQAEAAFEIATEAEAPDLVVPLALNLTQALQAAGDFRKNIEVASKGIALMEKTHTESVYSGGFGNENVYCTLLGLSCSSLALLGEFEEAKVLAEKCLSFARKLDNKASIGLAFHFYAQPLWMLGDSKNSAKYLKQAISYFEKLDNTVLLSAAVAQMGIAYIMLSDLRSAAEFANRALDIVQRSGVAVFTENVFWVKGWVETELGNFGEAIRALERCVEMSIAKKNRACEGMGRIFLGRAMFKGDASTHGSAEASVLQGLQIYSELGLRPFYAWGCLFLAELYADAGQKRKALKQLRKAQTMCREMEMEYWLRKTETLLEKLDSSGKRPVVSHP